jgi:uncharacterized protein YcaQ
MKLADVRRAAATRSLFGPTGLAEAIERLGYVQADPIRAPARAQDLILRHRVRDYRAGDLERRYGELPVEEDYLHNYGFVSRTVHAALHPRPARAKGSRALEAKVRAFFADKSVVHPREVAAALGTVRVGNAWGGTSAATTQALDRLHFAGALRVHGRVQGTRVYAACAPAAPAKDAKDRAHCLVAAVLALHAPLPSSSLTYVLRLLRYGAPQQGPALAAALAAKEAAGEVRRFLAEGLEYVDWAAPPEPEEPAESVVRFLAPFDPIVWDRRRFLHLFGWEYKLEAYTPPAKRRFGYYALPILWRNGVIGWVNAERDGSVRADYVEKPKGAVYRARFDDEVDRLRVFLGAPP